MDLNRRQTSGHKTTMDETVPVARRPHLHVTALNELLADMLVVEHKLRAFHWTVTGPRYFELHDKFLDLYRTLSVGVTDVGGRVVALGGRPLGSLESALVTAVLPEVDIPLTARQMV